MAIDYPAALPVPQTSVITPLERRALSNPDAPLEGRAASRDRLQFERVTWTLSDAQVEIFRAWWKTDLTDGGAWFNASWPVLEGIVERQHAFRTQPAYAFIPGGFWKVSALLEIRGRSRPVAEGIPGEGSSEIAWFDPIDDSITGTLLHSNSGSGPCDSFAPGAVLTLYAGLIGWTDQVIEWSILWDSVEDASPIIDGAFDNYVRIVWVAVDGSTFPVSPASIGSLIVTATVNGTPIAVGQRLVAVTTPPTIDYPNIAWGPE